MPGLRGWAGRAAGGSHGSGTPQLRARHAPCGGVGTRELLLAPLRPRWSVVWVWSWTCSAQGLRPVSQSCFQPAAPLAACPTPGRLTGTLCCLGELLPFPSLLPLLGRWPRAVNGPVSQVLWERQGWPGTGVPPHGGAPTVGSSGKKGMLPSLGPPHWVPGDKRCIQDVPHEGCPLSPSPLRPSVGCQPVTGPWHRSLPGCPREQPRHRAYKTAAVLSVPGPAGGGGTAARDRERQDPPRVPMPP